MALKIPRFTRIVLAILSLGFVIFFHELGHFSACKLFGVRTPTFSIGFGPKLASYKVGSTEFQLAALPLGGYVEIDPIDIATIPYWQKIIIVFAGVFFNFLLAFILFFLLVRTKGTMKASACIAHIVPDSPAQKAGLQEDDCFTEINGVPVKKSIDPVLREIQQHPEETIPCTIQRDAHVVHLQLHIGSKNGRSTNRGIGWAGINFHMITVKEVSLLQSIKDALLSLVSLGQGIIPVTAQKSMATGSSSLIGPIGIVSLAEQSIAADWGLFVLLMAQINVSLGFFNILPIPFFDGGQAVRYTIEALAGTHLSSTAISIAHLIFLFALILWMLYITKSDIQRTFKKK